jgi:hypothetical protein
MWGRLATCGPLSKRPYSGIVSHTLSAAISCRESRERQRSPGPAGIVTSPDGEPAQGRLESGPQITNLPHIHHNTDLSILPSDGRPINAMAISNSVRSISTTRRTPSAPATPRPYRYGRPI